MSSIRKRARVRGLETALETEPRVAPLFMVLALAGTRPGEAMALRIGDIDFAGLTLQIERAVWPEGVAVGR
jgi:integrase